MRSGLSTLVSVFSSALYDAYENLLVDDGTSVIDCSHRQSPARIPQANGDPGPSPKPVAYVSHSVCIVGNVKRQYETRQILVNNIGVFGIPLGLKERLIMNQM